MKTVNDWKLALQAATRDAMRARQTEAVAVFREVLAALDNAEAADMESAPRAQDGPIAGAVAGLGAGEVPRRTLGAEEVRALFERELRERREAAEAYGALGRVEEAEAMRRRVEVLESVIGVGARN
jgi:uncharacterized protein YqeY